MLLERYINTVNAFQVGIDSEGEIIFQTNNILSKHAEIEMTSKLDTNKLAKMAFYYNFASYSILAGCVYVICMIISSFKDKKIQRRTMVSSMKFRKYNMQLLFSNILLGIAFWIVYVILSFILIGDSMFSEHGYMYMLNSFAFTMLAVSVAFLIGNIVKSKNAINGIVNVVALGSSFLCGAFVPLEYLPDSVLKIAHILPSFYYISNNETISSLETINHETINPIIINMGIVLAFAVGFIIITNIIVKKTVKQD